MSGFTNHVREAIHLNRNRRSYYAYQTKGKSRFLSNFLILSEWLTLPIARYFDWRARPFNKKGIGVVKEDFVAMRVKAQETPPVFYKAIHSQVLKEQRSKVKQFLRMMAPTKDLENVVVQCRKFLENLEADEEEVEVHFAMLKHLIESVAFIANNGLQHSIASSGKSENLTKQLINVHCLAIRLALKVDFMANKFHQKGIGIIVNDMPTIEIN